MADGLSRRRFLAWTGGIGMVGAGAGGGVAYVFGGNTGTDTDADTDTDHHAAETTPTPAQPRATATPNATVQALKPLAGAFFERVGPEYEDARVFITQAGTIAMSYTSTASGGRALQSEFEAIAVAYGKTIAETEGVAPDAAVSLSIFVGGVEAVVPREPVVQFAQGDIERAALAETIEVLSHDRRTTSQ